MDRYQEISEQNVKRSNKNKNPPPYRKIKTNRVLAKLRDLEYNACECRYSDPSTCSIENDCHNAITKFECDPDLCPAKNMCQNQNFHRGQQLTFQIKLTKLKGWGLYAIIICILTGPYMETMHVLLIIRVHQTREQRNGQFFLMEKNKTALDFSQIVQFERYVNIS